MRGRLNVCCRSREATSHFVLGPHARTAAALACFALPRVASVGVDRVRKRCPESVFVELDSRHYCSRTSQSGQCAIVRAAFAKNSVRTESLDSVVVKRAKGGRGSKPRRPFSVIRTSEPQNQNPRTPEREPQNRNLGTLEPRNRRYFFLRIGYSLASAPRKSSRKFHVANPSSDVGATR